MDDTRPYRRPWRKIVANQPGTLKQQLLIVQWYLDDPDRPVGRFDEAAYQRARRRVLAHARKGKR